MPRTTNQADRELKRHGPNEMKSYCEYMKRVTSIHKETVKRLLDCEQTDLLEIAELFEDTANLYMNISEEIRTKVMALGAAADNRRDLRSIFRLQLPMDPAEDTQD